MPARNINRWETICASAGFSLRTGRKKLVRRMDLPDLVGLCRPSLNGIEEPDGPSPPFYGVERRLAMLVGRFGEDWRNYQPLSLKPCCETPFCHAPPRGNTPLLGCSACLPIAPLSRMSRPQRFETLFVIKYLLAGSSDTLSNSHQGPFPTLCRR